MPKALSKTDARYWLPRLFKRTGDDYHVQIAFAGLQERFPLRTPNKDAAATLARDIYLSLHQVGWEETRKKFKPWTNKVEKINSPTVGEFVSVIETYARVSPITLKSYTRKFRRLVAGVLSIKGDNKKFDRIKGSVGWRAKVDAVKLSELTPAKISKWKALFVAAQRGNPKLQNRAETTAQSIIRNARSLFSKRILRQLAEANIVLQLPTPLPFEGVEIGRTVNHRYTSNIDAEKLASDAQKELAAAQPEEFKIFLLAFGVGLRRGEIDRLTWAQFNWSKAQINIEATAHGDTKTDSSVAPVDVDPEVMKLFQAFKDKASGVFVIESTVEPRPGVNWHHYRCNCAFARVNDWLRAKGVDTPNPIHTLRKEFGTLICQRFGIFAASEALRHSDIRLTRAHYVDRRGRIHLEVGKMLGGGK